MFEFASPWIFVLLPLPLFLIRQNQQRGNPLFFPPLAMLAAKIGDTGALRRWQRPALLPLLFWLCLLCAAAQPRWVGEPVTLPQQGRDMMLAVDLSGSMNINDMVIEGQSYNRLDAVKHVLSQFIAKRQGDRQIGRASCWVRV